MGTVPGLLTLNNLLKVGKKWSESWFLEVQPEKWKISLSDNF